MAYTLNSVNLSVYGITPGQISGSNIAVKGCFDMPERIGDTYRSWGNENGIEAYVLADEMFFGGRDIVFEGFISGTNSVINAYISALKTAINAFTGLVVFSIPYGDFSVLVKTIVPEHFNGVSRIVITFRELIVTLTGGTLPVTSINAYSIDNIPLSSFGLYYYSGSGSDDLTELKEQYFTKTGSEGFQLSKRNFNQLDFNGFLIADNLTDFQAKIKALYLLFSSAGLRTVKLNNVTSTCFAKDGFSISSIIIGSKVIARFNTSLTLAD
jgi:hypothetical protein